MPGTLVRCAKVAPSACYDDVLSVVVYNSPEHVESIHGHGGYTDLVWLDPKLLAPQRTASREPLAAIAE